MSFAPGTASPAPSAKRLQPEAAAVGGGVAAAAVGGQPHKRRRQSLNRNQRGVLAVLEGLRPSVEQPVSLKALIEVPCCVCRESESESESGTESESDC